MSFLYRPHISGRLLDDSMKAVVELKDKKALISHIKKYSGLSQSDQMFSKINNETIKVEKYAYDNRINWDTHIVTLEVEGRSGTIGYTDRQV